MTNIDIPMPSVFVSELLKLRPTDEIADNSDASALIVERALADLNNHPISGPSPEGNEVIATMMAEETIWHLSQSGAPTAINWYTGSIEDMISVCAMMHPELKSDEIAQSTTNGRFKTAKEAQTVFFGAIAITSQNNKVNENLRFALEQYRIFVKSGKFDPAKTYGAKGGAISHNLDRFNMLVERANNDLTRVYRLLTMRLKMSDLRAVAAKNGIAISSSELADEMVYGSILFGPKVGNGFFQNLIGNHKPVTIDLWFMRTWGRYTGTLVRGDIVDGSLDKLKKGLKKSHRNPNMLQIMKDEGVYLDPEKLVELSNTDLFQYTKKLRAFWEGLRRAYVAGKIKDNMSEKLRALKRSNVDASDLKSKLGWPLAAESIMNALGYPIDSPKSAGQRKWIREVVEMALEKLKNKGFNITAADMQATLWYPEKEIYGKLTGRSPERMNTSYDEAARKIALSEGYTDEQINVALRSDGDRRPNGRNIPGSASVRIKEQHGKLAG